jgi:hypothetical protein
MVQCRECKKEVSDQAKTCPSCGIANPAPSSRFWTLLKIGIGLYIVVSISQCAADAEKRTTAAEAERQRVEAAKSPEQKGKEAADKLKREAEFQSVVVRLKSLKASLNDPASFDLVEALLMPDGTLCVTYRGTNAFNAVLTKTSALSTDLKVVDWNRYCAGKTGTDMLYARRAL